MGVKAKHKVFEFLESGLSSGKTAALNMACRKKVQTFSKKGVAKNSGSGIISPCRRAESAEAKHSSGRLAQGESASLTRKRSQVQIL